MTDSNTEKKEWGNKNFSPPTKIPETLYEAIWNMHLDGKKPKQIQVWLRDEHGIICCAKTVANHLSNIKESTTQAVFDKLDETSVELTTDSMSTIKRRMLFIESKINFIWTHLNDKDKKLKELNTRTVIDLEKSLHSYLELQLKALGIVGDDRIEVQEVKEKELLKKVEEISGIKLNEFPEE